MGLPADAAAAVQAIVTAPVSVKPGSPVRAQGRGGLCRWLRAPQLQQQHHEALAGQQCRPAARYRESGPHDLQVCAGGACGCLQELKAWKVVFCVLQDCKSDDNEMATDNALSTLSAMLEHQKDVLDANHVSNTVRIRSPFQCACFG